jgi:pimeloyl-ACP methyl ester carboxylesterase
MKSIVQFISVGFALYTLVLVVFYFLQDKMLFFPGPEPFGKCQDMEQRGAAALSIKDVRYYLKTKSNPNNWIIIFHGNAGNACDRTYFLDLLKDFNSNVAVFEYPGYGKDSNSPGEKIILTQALELIRYIKENNQDNLPVYLMGESIGTGVATFIASQTKINGLILISGYTSIAKVAQYHYPWLPVNWLMRNKFAAYNWAGMTTAPAILFHGIKDDIIPVGFARKQVLNFKGPKQLIEIPECGHNDILDVGEIIIQGKIRDFLKETK